MKKCKTLSDVRKNIDALDRKIVALFAERGGYVKQAAQFKKSDDEVKAPDRVAQVLEKVAGIAREVGANEEVIVAIYRAAIAGFTNLELSEHAASKKAHAEKPFDPKL